MNKTGIEYLTHTWNPLAMRCTKISAGCANCWHIKMADRCKNNPTFPKEIREAYAGDGQPILVESRLNDPLKLKKPAMIGVQFMGDLWHEDVTFRQIDKVKAVIAKADPHNFLILTKRPQRMIEFDKWSGSYGDKNWYPFENLWLGVSIEDQKTADERVPTLLQIPAAVRFVSYEPALGPIIIPKHWFMDYYHIGSNCDSGYQGINWIIAGCESGPKRRPAKIEWFRDIKNQCVEAGTPFFLKQMVYGITMVKMPTLDGQVWDQIPKT